MKKMGLNQQLVNNEGYLDGCQNGFRVVTCFFWWKFMGYDIANNNWYMLLSENGENKRPDNNFKMDPVMISPVETSGFFWGRHWKLSGQPRHGGHGWTHHGNHVTGNILIGTAVVLNKCWVWISGLCDFGVMWLPHVLQYRRIFKKFLHSNAWIPFGFSSLQQS